MFDLLAKAGPVGAPTDAVSSNWAFEVPKYIDWLAITPFIAIVFTGILALIIHMLKIKEGARLVVTTSLLGLALTGGLLVYLSLQGALDSFDKMLYFDRVGIGLSLVLVAICFLCVLFSPGYLKEKKIAYGEFYPLIIWATTGGMLMVTTKNLLVVFLGLEILSVGLYVLAGMSRREHKSEESAIKYFLLGAFASAFLLFGISFIYGATGSLSIEALNQYILMKDATIQSMVLIGLGLIVIGFGFKSAFVPFHQWTPDVYQGAPTNVAAYMAAGSKVAAIGALYRVFIEAKPFNEFIIPALFWIAIATMTIGNLAAVMQKDVKRILGFSSIAQAGYILVAIIAQMVFLNSSSVSPGTIAFYLSAYGVMTIGAFAVVSLVAKGGNEETRLSDLNGLWKRSPFIAATLLVFMCSLIGIPFTAGFAGKLMIFTDALKAGLLPLALVLAANSIISVSYYLKIGFAAFVDEEAPQNEQAKESPGLVTVCGLCAIGVLAMFVFSGSIAEWFNK